MIKYFCFPSQFLGGRCIRDKEETAKKINKYAEEKNLRIMQISVCDDSGLFVVFEKLN